MSDTPYKITQFISTSLDTATIKQRGDIGETGDQPISRIRTLTNGTKVDIDGTNDSTLVPGAATVHFNVTGSTAGTNSLNTSYATIRSLRGKVGTLTGVRVSAGGATTNVTCTARLVRAYMIQAAGEMNIPVDGIKTNLIVVECIWERLTVWS
jgi:hypothetical protein